MSSAYLGIIPLFIIGIVPVLSYDSNLGYEGLKILFFYLSLCLVFIIWLATGFKQLKNFKSSLIFKTLTVFILALILTSVLGVDLSSSLVGKYPYYQGLILYIFLYLFYLYLRSIKLDIKLLAISLSVSATAVSLFALKQWIDLTFFNLTIPNYAGRVISSFGQPNLFAGFLILTLPFCYLLTKQEGKIRALGWGSILFATLAIFASMSRTAILIYLILLLGWLISRFAGKLLIVLMAGGLLVLLFSGLMLKEVIEPQSNLWLLQNSPEKRIFIWQAVGQLVLQKPILGYGLENIDPVFSDYFQNQDYNTTKPAFYYSLKNLVVSRAHSYPLDLLVFGGVVALGSWFILIWSLLKRLVKHSDKKLSKILLTGLIIYLAWSAVQIQSVVQLMFFFLLVALIDSES